MPAGTQLVGGGDRSLLSLPGLRHSPLRKPPPETHSEWVLPAETSAEGSRPVLWAGEAQIVKGSSTGRAQKWRSHCHRDLVLAV